MPQLQTRNQDLEKRLAQLRSQLYGKKSVASSKYQVVREDNQPFTTNYQRPTTDLTFLRHDLLKIFLLAGLAFTFQFGLYFAMVNKLIKLPF